MRSVGVFPTNAPSTQICAEEGVERNNNLPASWPACSSRALRLTTSGGGPEGITRCLGPLGSAGLPAGKITVFPAVAVAVAEADVAPEYSVAACPLATPHTAPPMAMATTKLRTNLWV